MRKIILFLTLFFAVNNGYSQYTQIPLSDTYGDNVAIINRLIENHFYAISKKWTVDSYVGSSADIRLYYETMTKNRKPNGPYMIKVKGTYKYKRLLKTYTGTYEAIIAPNLNNYREFKISSLHYEEQ